MTKTMDRAFGPDRPPAREPSAAEAAAERAGAAREAAMRLAALRDEERGLLPPEPATTIEGEHVPLSRLGADSLLDALREEARIAEAEGLGHFAPDDFGDPDGGEATVVFYGRRYRLRCEAVDPPPAAAEDRCPVCGSKLLVVGTEPDLRRRAAAHKAPCGAPCAFGSAGDGLGMGEHHTREACPVEGLHGVQLEETHWWCVDARVHASPEVLVAGATERDDGFQDCGHDAGPCDESAKTFGTRADAERAMAARRH